MADASRSSFWALPLAEDGVEHAAFRVDVAADDDIVEHAEIAEQPARLEGARNAPLDDLVHRNAVQPFALKPDLAG